LRLIPIRILHGGASLDIDALVDSGAEQTVLSLEIAEELGIDLSDAEDVIVVGAGGEELGGLDMRRTLTFMASGALLGAVAGCVPAAVAYLGMQLFPRHGDWGLFSYAMMVMVHWVVFGVLGIFTGVIGGAMYAAGQRLATAASPCVGFISGGIVSAFGYVIAERLDYLVWLAPAVGGLLGVLYARENWR
jgi:hypothetical protein